MATNIALLTQGHGDAVYELGLDESCQVTHTTFVEDGHIWTCMTNPYAMCLFMEFVAVGTSQSDISYFMDMLRHNNVLLHPTSDGYFDHSMDAVKAIDACIIFRMLDKDGNQIDFNTISDDEIKNNIYANNNGRQLDRIRRDELPRLQMTINNGPPAKPTTRKLRELIKGCACVYKEAALKGVKDRLLEAFQENPRAFMNPNVEYHDLFCTSCKQSDCGCNETTSHYRISVSFNRPFTQADFR